MADAAIDREVLGAIAGDVLSSDVVEEVVREAHALFGYSARADVEADQRRELEKLEREQTRLTDAIAPGAAVPALVSRLQETERRRLSLGSALDQASRRPQPPAWATIERRVRQSLGDWRALLQADVPAVRDAFRQLLAGRTAFEPFIDGARRGVRFTGRDWPRGRALGRVGN